MEKEELIKFVERYFELCSKYPDIVNTFRKFSTVSSFYNYLKTTDARTTFEISEKYDSFDEKNLKHYIGYFSDIIKVLEQTEIDVIKMEEGRKYKYPTYNFDKYSIFEHADKIKSVPQKLNYLNYIRKEFPDHYIRRKNFLNKNMLVLLKKYDVGLMILKFLGEAYRRYGFDFKKIIFPLFESTLPERLDAEIAYYNGFREVKPEGNETTPIDISEILRELSDSKSIEIKQPEKLIKILCKHLKIDFDYDNSPEFADMQKQFLKSLKTMKESKYYTIMEVCEMLKISRTKLYNLRRDGVLSFTQYGKSVRIPKSEIDEYIKENTYKL